MEEVDCDEEEFGFSRNYFLARELAAGSGKKSGHKLSDITPIDEQDLRAAASCLETKHEKEISSLMKSYKSLYPQWAFQLRCGFSLLMYGFGSKRTLIEDFASNALIEWPVVVINGYLPAVNVKQVMIAMAEALWDQMKSSRKASLGKSPKDQAPFNSRSTEDLLAFLDGSHSSGDGSSVYVAIHNIDGPGLRDADAQLHLARIASCSLVRVVASIDHVNAPLLWDKKMAHMQFNWYWHHVPTFAPYAVEGTFYPLILAHGGAAQSAKTGVIVLRSLTPNAQNVFRLLAEHQLAHPDEEGMGISDLYRQCRERFVVSSQVTLNSHLTEFKDHELVKSRRNPEGQDCIYIPLASEAIEKLLADLGQ